MREGCCLWHFACPPGAPIDVALALRFALAFRFDVAARPLAPLMPGPLRVFVSSTMRDLANERDEVVRQLKRANFEPVNAETILPDGTDSWSRLQTEIEASDLFVLILGGSYGWIPEKGPKAGEGKSVTQLEFEEARSLGLPVFIFSKILTLDGTDTASEDAKRRDAFRKEVANWDGGYYRGDFHLAHDLAEKVSSALVGFLSDRYRERLLRRRSRPRPPLPGDDTGELRPMRLSGELVDSVADGSAVLLLGAGASLQAGLPSAALFVEAMIERIREVDPHYAPGASGSLFNAVATDFESLLDVNELWRLAEQLVDPKGLAQPTEAHRIAVELFPTIVTTNYDLLIERALRHEGAERRIVTGDADDLAPSTPVLIKLHGSVRDPEQLVLTEVQLANLERTRPALWAALQDELRRRPLISVGSSLRDPSLVRLLEGSRPEISGWAVLYDFSIADRLRLARWGLEPLHGDAATFFATLDKEVAARRDG
jgi:hypothetical protein